MAKITKNQYTDNDIFPTLPQPAQAMTVKEVIGLINADIKKLSRENKKNYPNLENYELRVKITLLQRCRGILRGYLKKKGETTMKK